MTTSSLSRPVSRRQFLAALTAASASAGVRAQDVKKSPPVRQITRGPGFHWFAYYDKQQFSPDNRFVLGNKVHFEHRSPTADDVIEVGMVDLDDNDKWIPLGTSRAWCWQQGCMLQWVPGNTFEVIWNVESYRHWSQEILSLLFVVARAVDSNTVKKSTAKVILRANFIREVQSILGLRVFPYLIRI